LLLQHAAPVAKYQHLDNTNAFSYVVNVSNVLLLFAEGFDELSLCNSLITFVSIIQFSIYCVNFTIFRTIVKILQMHCWGILM